MNDYDLLETESMLDVCHKQNLIRDEIMLALNCFPIFDTSVYDDVSDFLWLEYNTIVDSSLHVHCPEVLSYHLNFYFERDLDFHVVIEILD
nr:MAG TPA: hypothetical protein [Inoviridae sp.]